MIKILDRFLVKNWIALFVATFGILCMISFMGDFIDFMMKHDITFQKIIQNLIVKSTIIIAKILPIACIMSSLFFINKLKTHSELTAILASGFGKKRIANMLVFGGLFAFLIQFINTGFHEAYVYDFNQSLEKSFSSKYSKRVSTDSGIWFKNNNYFGSFFYFDQRTSKIIKPKLFFYRDGLVHQTIEADQAVLLREKTWEFQNVKSRKFLSNKTDFPKFEKHETLTQELKEDFKDFNRYQSGVMSLSIFKLKSFISNLQSYKLNVREYLVLFYDKLATALSCFIFTVFPIFTLHNIGKRFSSAGRSIFLTLLFTLCFWFVAGSTQTIGAKFGLSPFLSVFATHLVLLVFCAYHYSKLEKLN